MAKVRTIYLCRSCGSSFPRWMGRCPDCSAWDSLEASRDEGGAESHKDLPAITWSIDPDAGGDGSGLSGVSAPKARAVKDIHPDADRHDRIPSGLGELDRVLGGRLEPQTTPAGLVPGSVVLIGGEPGIGKSTLLLQAAAGWGESGASLYVTSEESAEQVRARADRLGVAGSAKLFILPETNLARIIEQARAVRPRVLLIDSIQMIYRADLPASPGSVTQLRRCCAELVYLAKATGVAVVIVGHVTKQGQLAGPRLVEHLVDAVVYFEGDRDHGVRTLRAIKNRFGTTLELGLFDMTGVGLRELPEGAGVAAAELGEPRPGSAVCPVLHGSRCLLVELQALTATGFLGAAKRKSSGLDASRLAMLIAVLEQHAGLRLADRDIFASCVGGLRVTEPAADLALLLSIAGAHHRRALEKGTVALGEVGLGGEVRPVTQLEQRLLEAARMGYTRAIVPTLRGKVSAPKGLQVCEVANVDRAIEHLG